MNATVRDWVTGLAIGAIGGPLFFVTIVFSHVILKEPYGLLSYYALLFVPATHYPLRYAEKVDEYLNAGDKRSLVRANRILAWLISASALWFTLPSGWFIMALLLQVAICLCLDAFMWGQRFTLPREISGLLSTVEIKRSFRSLITPATTGLIFILAYACLHFLSPDPMIIAKRPILIQLVLLMTVFWLLTWIQAGRHSRGMSRWSSVLWYSGFVIIFVILPFLGNTYVR